MNAPKNVMTVCSFDMRFTWIWLGWEGSAHDWRIFTEAKARSNSNFLHPPPGNTICLILVIRILKGTLDHMRIVNIVCKTIMEGGIGPGVLKKFSVMHTHL